MTLETKILREKRGGLITQMEAITKKSHDEKREMTPEEESKWESLDLEQEKIMREIKRVEKLNELTSNQESQLLSQTKNQSLDEIKTAEENKAKAYIRYLIVGEHGLKEEERKLLVRGSQSTTTTAGGYLIPQAFSFEYDKAMLEFGGVREIGRTYKTASGADYLWPNANDTSNKSVILSENTGASNGKDLVFGSTTLKAFMYSTDVIRVPLQLLQDSGIDIVKIIAELLAERDARGLNYDFTVGAGTTAPKGVVTCAGAGKTLAATNAITFSEIIDLIHTVDPAYRKNGKIMLHDTTLKAIKKLSIGTSDARPLWDAGIFRSGVPPTIDGYEYIINQDMDNIDSGAGKKIMLFGDFKSFIIRDVMDYQLLRLNELYAASLQVGFLGFSRHDARSVASDSPWKYMITAAS